MPLSPDDSESAGELRAEQQLVIPHSLYIDLSGVLTSEILHALHPPIQTASVARLRIPSSSR